MEEKSVHTRRRRWGDRYEGRRLYSIFPMDMLTPFFMRTRGAATNTVRSSFDITNAEKYMRLKRADGMPGFGMLHFLVAAYVRMVSQNPALNRFVSGKRIYTRHHVEVSMSVKKEMKVDAEVTTIKVEFDRRDCARDIYRKMNDAILEARREDSNDANALMRRLMLLPRPVLSFTVWLIELIDYYNMLPKALYKASPFHASLFLSDLGSINLPVAEHHLYDFGNCPVFITFGTKYTAFLPDRNGVAVRSRRVDFTASVDDRVIEGMIFSPALRMMNHLFDNPELLDTPPSRVVEDVE